MKVRQVSIATSPIPNSRKSLKIEPKYGIPAVASTPLLRLSTQIENLQIQPEQPLPTGENVSTGTLCSLISKLEKKVNECDSAFRLSMHHQEVHIKSREKRLKAFSEYILNHQKRLQVTHNNISHLDSMLSVIVDQEVQKYMATNQFSQEVQAIRTELKQKSSQLKNKMLTESQQIFRKFQKLSQQIESIKSVHPDIPTLKPLQERVDKLLEKQKKILETLS